MWFKPIYFLQVNPIENRNKMTFYLSGLNSVLLFFILFGVTGAFTLTGLLVIHRKFQYKKDDWVGFKFITSFFTIIGALLGVMLAMVLVTVWQNFQKEKETINAEISNFITLYTDAGGLSSNQCLYVREKTKELVSVIISDSWPSMEKGKYSTTSGYYLSNIYAYLGNLSLNRQSEVVSKKMMKNLEEIMISRRSRKISATQSLIPTLMWQVISICCAISITSGFFFYIKPFWVHVVLSLLHTGMITIVIFMILNLNYPYRGNPRITSNAYSEMIDTVFVVIDKEYAKRNKIK